MQGLHIWESYKMSADQIANKPQPAQISADTNADKPQPKAQQEGQEAAS